MTDKLIIAGVSIIFSGGVAWGIVKTMINQLRRDVNGLGRKVNRVERVLLCFCPEVQRKEIAQFLDK